ncbi:Uncharacterized protein AB751O23_AX_00080 [Chlamydiales bacterium SCGC AB-751-O23]|jgi:adenylate kinase family enzyme|nr:Uncharacterized protein AB751O23_AX_00080 [Chlamydiales bacterium SCGC AB-751-O23]
MYFWIVFIKKKCEQGFLNRSFSNNKNLKRVVIIGASGSGKTTLGKLLSSTWKLPLCDLDDLHWLSGWKKRDPSEEFADVENFLKGDKWLIVGNYSRYRAMIWPKADLIIWLDLPFYVCLWRGLVRSIRSIWYDLPLCNGNYDSLTRLFSWDNKSILYWISTTYNKKTTNYQNLLENNKSKKLPQHYRLSNSKQVGEFIDMSNKFDF